MHSYQGQSILASLFQKPRVPDSSRIPNDSSSTYPYNATKTYAEKNSHLEYKSKLQFLFPVSKEKSWVVSLPFYENPIISERKTANYANHKVIGRSSTLMTYLGSEARKLNLDFNLTLPLLAQFYNKNKSVAQGIHTSNPQKDMNRFFESGGWQQGPGPKGGGTGTAQAALVSPEVRPWAQDYDDFFAIKPLTNEVAGTAINSGVAGVESGIPLSDSGKVDYIASLNDSLPGKLPNTSKYVREMIDIIVYWVELLRSTCYNNNDNPIYGPPIVRVSHGILFRKIPCIVDSYEITVDEAAGYHKNTMLPRRLKITLSLTEIRAGNFGKFLPNDTVGIDGYNLAGYEVLFTGGMGDSLDVVPLYEDHFS